MGYNFEDLAKMIHNIHPAGRVGVCIDTCHAFAAGYDFRTPQLYKKMWNEFDDLIGLKHLKAIHINDSKKDLGSHVDRHEHIGKGKLGIEPFHLLFNDHRFFDIPKILETPKEHPLLDDLNNINVIKSLLEPTTKKSLHITD